MAEIKAFVAHSFSEEDKALVGVFVEHFNSLAGSLPGFSWDHAQQAEPESISRKVLSKIEDKNVFIGVCTRSEWVTSHAAIYRLPVINLVRLRESDIEWKTSDWIIQEIGLAVGRQMKVILFLENGVREPGGLFGDIEYIPFARTNPQASFDKLLQMLGKLNPKQKVVASAGATKSATADKVESAEPNKDWTPQPDWDQDKYDEAAFNLIVFEHDAKAFNELNIAFRASPFGKGIALTMWEARSEYLRILSGEKSDFEKIKQAARDNPTSDQLLFYLGCGYREFGEHRAAARAFEEASTKAEKESERLRYLANAASQYAQAGQWNHSNEIVERLKEEVGSKLDLQYELLSHLQDLPEAEKNDVLHVAIMERMVELRPSMSSIRFALAFKHSEIGNSDMALHHYLKIPVFDRNAVAWNNLGVAFGNFGMPIKSIRAYRVAENRNETLAMCNLGFKLLSAGFLPEAKEEADKAASIEYHHKNVPELLTRLNDAPDEEDAKLAETLENIKTKAAFYRRLGESILKATPAEIALKWDSPEGPLEGKMDGMSVRFSGSQQRPLNALAAGILPLPLGGVGSQVAVTHRIEFEGRARGDVIIGQVRRRRDGETPSLMGSDDNQVVMVFNEDHSEIAVMENPSSLHPRFYTIARSSA